MILTSSSIICLEARLSRLVLVMLKLPTAQFSTFFGILSWQLLPRVPLLNGNTSSVGSASSTVNPTRLAINISAVAKRWLWNDINKALCVKTNMDFLFTCCFHDVIKQGFEALWVTSLLFQIQSYGWVTLHCRHFAGWTSHRQRVGFQPT